MGIELWRGAESCSRHVLRLSAQDDLDFKIAERTLKFLLWQKGASRLRLYGPDRICELLCVEYSNGGARAFDVGLMSQAYGTPFSCEHAGHAVPFQHSAELGNEERAAGRHLAGNRIGFDLGASDLKAAAVVNGETVFSTETVWQPRDHADPSYHRAHVAAAIHEAASHLPSVDAVGGSSAGVIFENQPMVGSLFRAVSPEDLESEIRPMFLDLGRSLGVPIEVANDGDVTALAGSMALGVNSLLGIAMGSSEAAGYVNAKGNITGWLNELAFAPIDYRPDAPADEWSGDVGCGVQYLTQQAVFRLAEANGIDLSSTSVLAEKLRLVQDRLATGDTVARQIWESIGVYTGYALLHYSSFYDIRHVMILGRVTSGEGGSIIVDMANAVLSDEAPALAQSISVFLPDEKTRRVGQAVAAASLPKI